MSGIKLSLWIVLLLLAVLYTFLSLHGGAAGGNRP